MADLYRAAVTGEAVEVQRLLDAQADVTYNLGDKYGWTPLHIASDNGHIEIVKMLIEAQAPLEVKDKGGNTPIHRAAWKGHTAVAEMLLKVLIDAGASLDIQDNHGSTPLHYATWNGHTAVAELLISAGASLNVQDNDGYTALHNAVIQDRHTYIMMLIASGASADMTNRHGQTPRGCADNTVTRRVIDEAVLLESKYEIQVPLDRVKVFLCGDGAVGKSTLSRALQRSDFSMWLKKLPKAVDERTHGFDSFPATIPTAGLCTIVDFAGQPEYWASNSLFMDTVSGVFVVLCKLTDPFEQQFEQLRYWVRLIASQTQPGTKPRVVLVGTHRGAAKAIRMMLDENANLLTPLEVSDLKASLARLERITAAAGGLWRCDEVEAYVAELHTQLGHLVDISPRLHYVDSVSPAKGDRAEMSAMRAALGELMKVVRSTRSIPKVCADVVSHLPFIREKLPAVAPFTAVHLHINKSMMESVGALIMEDRMKAILGYLADAGHVMYFEDIGDMVVVDPEAFGTHVIGQLFCPVAKEGFTSLVLTEEDGLHFRESQLNAALQHAHAQGHIFGDVALVLKMLVALEFVIPLGDTEDDHDADTDPLYSVPGRLCPDNPGAMQLKYLSRPDDCWEAPLKPELWHYMGVRLTVCQSQLIFPPSVFPRLQHRLSREVGFVMWRRGLSTRRMCEGLVEVEGIVEMDRSLEFMDVCVRSETGNKPSCLNLLTRLLQACEGFSVPVKCSTISVDSMRRHSDEIVRRKASRDSDVTANSDCSVKPSEWVQFQFAIDRDHAAGLSIVASCPHTASLSNDPSSFAVDNIDVFDVFEHCEELRVAGRLKVAYDQPGASTTSPARDAAVVWSLEKAPGATKADKWKAVKESVSGSVWFELYQTRIKVAVISFAQDHPDREIHLLCIKGGPITELEQEAMLRIAHEVRSDMTLYKIHNRIKIELLTYKEFVAIFGHAKRSRCE